MPRDDTRLFADLIGAEFVLDDRDECAFYSQDISGEGAAVAGLVVQPGSVDELCRCVAAATNMGRVVVPRGGGMSYTLGYAPAVAGAVLIDLRRLNRVVEINEAGCSVTVEAGCTWKDLYDALTPRGLRTPFFGPLSGYVSTIGGAASQNAAFFGSSFYGSMEESVLGLDIVVADGGLVRSVELDPESLELLIGDAGAFGVKARVTLKLIRAPNAVRFASFAFESFADLVAAQTAMAGSPGLAECFGFDPETHANLQKSGFKLSEGAGMLGDVARAGGGMVRGVKDALKTAALAPGLLKNVRYSLHAVVEAEADPAADQSLGRIAGAAARHGGIAIPDTIPRVTRAKPFRPIKALLGPEGENWLPVHGIVPTEAAQSAVDQVTVYLDAYRAELASHDIRVAFLTTLVRDRFLLEPQFFWFDRLSPFHLRMVTDSQRKAYASRPAAPEARAAVHKLRHGLVEVFAVAGAGHYQIGKYYPYLERLEPSKRGRVKRLKAALDPRGLINPGALEL